MRIVSGKFKGRRFTPPADKWPTRPTTDFAKEALYNILQNRIDFEGIRALDLFGGTGNHSYELLSRGAEEVVYVDNFFPATKYVSKIAEELNISAQLKVLRMDVFDYLHQTIGQAFDLIIMDPPYQMQGYDKLISQIMIAGFLKGEGILVVEHNSMNDFADYTGFTEKRKYGGTLFSFFTN